MNYPDGNRVDLGDEVLLATTSHGVVVAVIDEGKFSKEYTSDEWSYLKYGILVKFNELGLVHIDKPCPDLELVARAGMD
ncbi:hypothetical protein [Tahibacter amnicola]|uniref:Uncharacterized protein n=1 Tax=Tahibacter amnicola TaxID=2976241 RepID=A0ABY6BF26_9GAMM|nr:hypothetical protein [Tahibacter amnicola]UXI67873.1 hypothetical protein N4264_24600 [Tahibacter amnicola]